MTKLAVKSGNWNDPTVWENAANVSTLSTAVNINVTTGGIFSVPFTPPAMTTITGLVVFPQANWTGRNITFTLQANSVDTMMSVTVSGADVPMNQPLYLRLPLNYIAAAGVPLRWKAVTSVGSCSIAQSSTASQFASMTTELVNAVPANELVMICAVQATNNTFVTITDTAAQAGSNAAASGSGAFATSPRWWDMGMQISGGLGSVMAGIIYSPTVNTALELKNSVWTFSNAKVTKKPNSGFTAQTNWTPGATIGANTLYWNWGQGSQFDIQGLGLATPANWKTKFTSGLGTAASPAVLVNGSEVSVGDYLVFSPTSNTVATNWGETEYRYVISKPSTNQVVLSSTSGGSENALVNTHAGGYVFNQTAGKNVIYKSTDTRSWHMIFGSTAHSSANSMLRWARFQDLYSSASAARGGLAMAGGSPLLEYLSLGTPGSTLPSQQMLLPSSNALPSSMTGIFAFNISPASAGDGTIAVVGINKTFTDSWIIDTTTRAWQVTGSNGTYNKCGVVAGGKGAVVGLYSGWAISGNANQFNDCEAHACRYAGMILYSGGADNVAVRYISGTLGKNGTDAVTQGTASPGYNTMYFDSPTIAEDNLMTNANAMLVGSKIIFNDVNSTPYNSFVYTPNGVEQYTGSGLADTTTSPLGFRTQRLAPIDTTGFKYRYEQLANPNQVFLTYGRAWVNAAALADSGFTVTVDLYLPGVVEGVDTPSATVTLTKTTTANSANAQYLLSAFYAGTRPLFATIVVTAKNTNAVASAYAYIGDILNGTNNITNQSTERRGTTSPIMFEQNGDANAVAAAVWADSANYPVNSKGDSLKAVRSNTDATQAKINLL